jgi:hypothetical protein
MEIQELRMSGPFSRDFIIGIYHGWPVKVVHTMRNDERERWGRGDCLD